jgi:tetratricopeptide (TPR) repeat protein
MGEARRRATGKPANNSIFPFAAVYGEAEQAHRRGDFATAREACERIVEADPGRADAQHLLGLALLETGERERGVEALRTAVELEPRNRAFGFNLALARRVVGDLRGAADAFAELGRRVPDAVEPQLELGTTLEYLGDIETAEAAYRRAILLQPGLVVAHAGLARTLFARDALDEAIAAQRVAAALDPRALLDGRIGSARATPSDLPRRGERAAVAAVRVPSAAGAAAALVAERELRVIDDFEADFAGWRDFALAQQYADHGAALDVNFPGLQTPQGYATPVQMQRIADAIGRDIKWRMPTNGAFRQSYAGSQARSDIHVDEEVCKPMYAGVLYLSLPEHCRGGTSFFRHRATGWATIPSAATLRDSPYADFREFQRREVVGRGERVGFAELTRRREAWEPVLEVPMRANRLILYRSDYFHAISEVFGSTPGDARLVQLFFFEPLAAALAN